MDMNLNRLMKNKTKLRIMAVIIHINFKEGVKTMAKYNNIDFFKKCRRPIYYKAKLNKLRNGETLILGSISEEIEHNGNKIDVCIQAYIEKESKGIYRLTGLWTVPTKHSRPIIWCNSEFKIDKSDLIFINDNEKSELKHFFLICRWLNIFKKHIYSELSKKPREKDKFYMNGIPYVFDGLELTKKFITKEAVICRYKKVNNKLTHYPRGDITYVNFENDIDKILTHPLKAIIDVGILQGCINLEDDTPIQYLTKDGEATL